MCRGGVEFLSIIIGVSIRVSIISSFFRFEFDSSFDNIEFVSIWRSILVRFASSFVRFEPDV